jgi:CRISPR/Cas system CMR subunit Cmr4 (Cas7 group RAMP superfamily)
MSAVMQADRSRKKGVEFTDGQIIEKVAAKRSLQLGGKATTGQGVVNFVPVGANP